MDGMTEHLPAIVVGVPLFAALLVTAVLQVVLGISTLVLAVPTLLAVDHQANALLLLASALYLLHALRRG